MYEYLNTIQTPLMPIERFHWQQMYEWPYSEIGKRIKTRSIIDVKGGCGLLGTFLVYYNYCETATLYDTHGDKLDYARALVDSLGLNNRIQIDPTPYQPVKKLSETMLVSTRSLSLPDFEDVIGNNRAITLRRTDEVEPYFIRDSKKVWNGEIIKRSDGFELEVLTR